MSREDKKLQKALVLVEQLRQSADAASAPKVQEPAALQHMSAMLFLQRSAWNNPRRRQHTSYDVDARI